VKTDDERLEKSRKEMQERIEKMDSLALTVSKGHLAIEQCMDDLISAALPHPESVLTENRFSFSRKGHICQALSLGQHSDEIWKVFWAVNQLRNKIAHTLLTREIQEKMDRLKRTYFDILTPKQVESLEDQPDTYIALSACSMCAGFIANVAEDAKARAQIITEHWKPR
jgi:hypothetical protein